MYDVKKEPKYKFKQPYSIKVATNYNVATQFNLPIEYRVFNFKVGDIIETVKNTTNTDASQVTVLFYMTPYKIPLNVLELTNDDATSTDLIKEEQDLKQYEVDKKTKNMFIIPTALLLIVVWVYTLRKL